MSKSARYSTSIKKVEIDTAQHEKTVRRQQQFDKLFATYDKTLRAYLRNQVEDSETASEIAQEVYIRLLKQPSLEHINGDTGPYMLAIALNLVRDRYRRHRVRHMDQHISLNELSFDESEIGSVDTTPEQIASWRQGVIALKQALVELDPKYCKVFLLSRLHGKTGNEIAQEMGVCPRTVERYMCKALEHCRRRLEIWL